MYNMSWPLRRLNGRNKPNLSHFTERIVRLVKASNNYDPRKAISILQAL